MFLREGIAVEHINQKHINYRNKTIHQGIFPDKENTMKVLIAICLKISDRIPAYNLGSTLENLKLYIKNLNIHSYEDEILIHHSNLKLRSKSMLNVSYLKK